MIHKFQRHGIQENNYVIPIDDEKEENNARIYQKSYCPFIQSNKLSHLHEPHKLVSN